MKLKCSQCGKSEEMAVPVNSEPICMDCFFGIKSDSDLFEKQEETPASNSFQVDEGISSRTLLEDW